MKKDLFALLTAILVVFVVLLGLPEFEKEYNREKNAITVSLVKINKGNKIHKRYGSYFESDVIEVIDNIVSNYGNKVLNKNPKTLKAVLTKIFVNETATGQYGKFNGFAYGLCQIEEISLRDAVSKKKRLVKELEDYYQVNLSLHASKYEDKPLESFLLAVIILDYKYSNQHLIKKWKLNNKNDAWEIYKRHYNSVAGAASYNKYKKRLKELAYN